MTQTLKPKLTRAGLVAVFNASSTGLQATISHIAFGDGNGAGYTPTGAETALKNEIVRVPVGGGERVGDFQIQVQSLLNTPDIADFWIREVAIILEDGTVLALWSDELTPLAYKNALTNLVVAFDLILADIPPNSVTVTTSGPSVNILMDDTVISLGLVHAYRQLREIKQMRASFSCSI